MFGIKKKIHSLKKLFDNKAIILMYHSISEPDIDPWELAVSPSNFEQQLQVLKQSFEISSVTDIAANVQKGSVKNKTVALTFDDGYRDNFQIAIPLLEKYNIPATFFITNNFGEKVYWWDRLSNLILRTPVLPEDFNITIKGESINYSIGEEFELNKYSEQLHRQWVAPVAAPPTKRSVLFYELWQLMQPLPPDQIEFILQQIKNWTGRKEEISLPHTSLITEEQLRELASHQLINIGIHTANHVALSYHSSQVQEAEILQNKKRLETILNRQIGTIAFPYGEYNNTTIDIIKKNGLQAGLTVEYNAVSNTSNTFALGRFQVNNWNAGQFEEKLLQWMKQ